MPNFMEISDGKIRLRRKPDEDDEDLDEDNMDDDDDDEDRESRRQQDRHTRREYERMRLQQEEAKRYAKRQQRIQGGPQIPLNPYAAPQPQYVSVEAISNLMDARFNRLEGMAQMQLVGTYLTVLAMMVVAMLLLLK
jgi:hypothetical protein